MGAFMWALSYGPPSFGRDCRLGLALRRQESLGFECSHAALPSSGHRLAIDIVPHEESAYSELFISHLLARNIQVEEDLVDQLFNSSEKRLARILLLLANLAPFHSITSAGSVHHSQPSEPEYDARYPYNTLQNTICRKNKE